eukprot:15098304-Alexandrium_andersonii.AAC.1
MGPGDSDSCMEDAFDSEVEDTQPPFPRAERAKGPRSAASVLLRFIRRCHTGIVSDVCSPLAHLSLTEL